MNLVVVQIHKLLRAQSCNRSLASASLIFGPQLQVAPKVQVVLTPTSVELGHKDFNPLPAIREGRGLQAPYGELRSSDHQQQCDIWRTTAHASFADAKVSPFPEVPVAVVDAKYEVFILLCEILAYPSHIEDELSLGAPRLISCWHLIDWIELEATGHNIVDGSLEF